MVPDVQPVHEEHPQPPTDETVYQSSDSYFWEVMVEVARMMALCRDQVGPETRAGLHEFRRSKVIGMARCRNQSHEIVPQTAGR